TIGAVFVGIAFVLATAPNAAAQGKGHGSGAAAALHQAVHQAGWALIAGLIGLRMRRWGEQIPDAATRQIDPAVDRPRDWIERAWPATISETLMTSCDEIRISDPIFM